jgi:serine/threonine protein kinase
MEELESWQTRSIELPDREIGWVHGDFSLDNILITKEGELIVHDFGDSRRGFFLQDVCRLWASIWAVSETSPLRARLLRPCLASFENAYGVDLGASNQPLLGLVRLWNCLCCLAGLAHAKAKAPFGSRSYMVRLAEIHRGYLEGRASGCQ